MSWSLRALEQCGPVSAWESAGFVVDDDTVWIGGIAVCCAVDLAEPAWYLERDGSRVVQVGGVLDASAAVLDAERRTSDHPIGATNVDHVVVATADLDRTIDELVACGLECRRVREVPGTSVRQAFFRLGPTILEVVGGTGFDQPRPAIWGIAIDVDNLDALQVRRPVELGRVRQAVQRGRRIAPLHGPFSLQVALMDHRGATPADG